MNVLIANQTGIGNFILKLPMIKSLLCSDKNIQIYLIQKKKNNLHTILKKNQRIHYIFFETNFDLIKIFFSYRNFFNATFLPFDSTLNSFILLTFFF